MGFFGVLAASDDHECEIQKLDINVWCLPCLFARTVVFCDIGIRVRPTRQIDHLELGIPFGTDKHGLTDLAPVLQRDATAAPLVFGKPYEPHRRDGRYLIEYGTDCMELAFIDKAQTVLEPGRSDGGFSHWRLVFTRALSPDVDTYLRARFQIASRGRAWTWRRSLLARHTATVDLRVCDLRETQTVPQGDDYEARLLPIAQLNCYVIHPAPFRTIRSSPEPRYVRLLEGRVWESYLGRATDLRREGKLVVTCWQPDAPVTAQTEFRALMELRRGGWTDRLTTFALVLLAVLGGEAVMANPADLDQSALVAAAKDLWAMSGIRLSIGIGALLAAGSAIARAFVGSRRRWRLAVRWLRRFEEAIYRIPAKLR